MPVGGSPADDPSLHLDRAYRLRAARQDQRPGYLMVLPGLMVKYARGLTRVAAALHRPVHSGATPAGAGSCLSRCRTPAPGPGRPRPAAPDAATGDRIR